MKILDSSGNIKTFRETQRVPQSAFEIQLSEIQTKHNVYVFCAKLYMTKPVRYCKSRIQAVPQIYSASWQTFVYNSKTSLGLRRNTSRNTRWLCSISNLSWNNNKEKQNCYTRKSKLTRYLQSYFKSTCSMQTQGNKKTFSCQENQTGDNSIQVTSVGAVEVAY